jgi:hypothetical protein
MSGWLILKWGFSMIKFIPAQGKFVVTLFLSITILLSGFLMLPNSALAQEFEDDFGVTRATLTCEGGTLNPNPDSDGSDDLLITAPCNVTAGEHMYRNVNIIANGVLNFLDEGAETKFWAKSILVENGGSLTAGTNSAAGAFGANGGTLTIYLYGSKTDAGIACRSPQRTSGIPCGVDSTIWLSNTKIAPKFPPVPMPACAKMTMPDGESECFYNYIDPMNPNADFFGSKVLAASYGGTLQMYGKKGATYSELPSNNSGKSWARLNVGGVLGKGATSLTLDRDVDWDEDDYIVLTTTDYLPGHSEKLKITEKLNVNSDGTTKEFKFIVVDSHTNEEIPGGLQYPHNGDTYKLAKVPTRLKLNITAGGQPAVETRAAVGLLTRSIRIVSAGDSVGKEFGPPTPGNYFGGHVMARQGVKSVEIQGVEFYQLGQGGVKGRYPVHMHLLRKSPKTFIKDNSVHDSMTRWITLHGTQGVTLARNVGYMSIGHGYYLEDGTEINNKLQSNLGVLARAAVENAQNPRRVPGILAANANLRDGNLLTSFSDYMQPTVFWLTNGWNDIEYNMAAGATACGACYWPVNAAVSGPSRYQKWESYASIKVDVDRSATAPIKRFKGNYCSTAMNSYNATVSTTPCEGVGIGGSVKINPVPNPLAPPPPGNLINDAATVNEFYYPRYSANPNATICRGTDCSNAPQCSADNVNDCSVTVLDGYTTAFHWTETNFSAIWLRRAFFTVINSAITNVLNAGLTFVTGGDYTQSSLLPGSFMLAANNVFIGNTEQGNPFSSNAGPFSKGGLSCENPIQDNNYCLSIDEGISMPLSNFGMNQRLFNIYDGPASQASNAYLDITKTPITDCTPAKNGGCSDSAWMYGRVLGMPRDVKEVIQGNDVLREVQSSCVLPNAAIAWKQPNGFYYPPAFHSDNLYFNNVGIRHFVLQPLFVEGTFDTNFPAVKENYCVYNSATFQGWTAIDRQTILNDDDGSLTGVERTISVNEDPFFGAPIEQLECRSEGSAKTSPYKYVTTVVYPGCFAKGDCGGTCSRTGGPCAVNANCPPPPPETPAETCDNTNWNSNCTSGCYGVPLVRQCLTASENMETDPNTEIRMQGPDIFGRINLTANNANYYIDTTKNQAQSTFPLKNIFTKNETYYTFFVFAKPEIKQKYQYYVGIDPSIDENDPQIVQAVRANIATTNVGFDDVPGGWAATGWDRKYDSGTGILTVTVDMENFKPNFDKAKEESCKPSSFCEFKSNSCQCSDQLKIDDKDLYDECQRINICRWSGNDPDCPVFDIGGKKQPRCLGISITMPGTFLADDMNHRPAPECFPPDDRWKVNWEKVGPDLAGQECYEFPKPLTNFCTGDNGPASMSRNLIEGTEGPDKLRGTMGADLIVGFGGDDEINGRGGDDIIEGGPGDDNLDGNMGDDTIVGGEGNDLIMGGNGADNIQAGEGDDFVKGGKGNDDISGGEGSDVLLGQRGNDEIDGNSGDDVIEGNSGADEIDGGPGDDSLLGGPGGDNIDGGSGDDLIEGGAGPDTCTQGESGTVCEVEE